MKLFRNIFMYMLAMTVGFIGKVNAQNMRSYTSKSVLSSGYSVKISVEEEGIYSFSYKELRDMGFSNPKNVHLRGYGGELLNEDFTEDNKYVDDLVDQPVVDLGDRIVFYLRGVIGFTKKNVSATNYIGITENYSSNYSYYFLHEENTEAKRIEYSEGLTEENIKETAYIALRWEKFHEVNIGKSGRNWLGSKFSTGDSKTFTFKFDNMVAGMTGNIYSNVVSVSSDHGHFTLSTNSTTNTVDVDKLDNSSNEYSYGYEKKLDGTVTLTSSNSITATYKYTTGSSSGVGYIDYIIAAAKCNLKGNVDYQTILVSPSSTERNITYAALNASSNFQIWDVSEIGNVRRVPARLSKDSLIFTVKTRPTVGRYIMVNWNGSFNTPKIEGKVENQNLHALKDIEYVVVTNPDFINQAKEIANFHNEVDGMSVAVVTHDQVFNEFSSGTPDPTAIRAFMKMLWDKANNSDYGVYPQYLLLFGDGTYDNRNILKKSDFNKMLTYQSVKSLNENNSYSSDDYFGFLEDGTVGYNDLYSNTRMNIGIGRFPVTTGTQADILVKKVKEYYNSEQGEWRTKFIAMADDDEKKSSYSGFHTFVGHQEEAISILQKTEPRMNVTRIYWDNYTRDVSGGSGRYPQVSAEITKKFSEGCLMFNYLGHSSYNAISEEHAYSIPHAQSLYNKIYPLWYAGSCNLSQYDDFRSCFGEEIILNANGGAIASIGTVRIGMSTDNLTLNESFIRQMFNPENDFRIGKILSAAKANRVTDSNKMVYTLLGDPGLKLKVPELNIVVDSTVALGTDGVAVKTDTMKALSRMKLMCHIEDESGNILNQFNGIANVTLKDKETKAQTKGNKIVGEKIDDVYVSKKLDGYTYNDRQSTLFSGSSAVANGKFEVQMIIPKDINYKVGNGRISMYAHDDSNGWDAIGADENLIIGGSATDVAADNVGPNIELTTNGSVYKDGFLVNPNPMFFIKLSDNNGINATGSSIGHNITLTIDDDTKNTISLNSYFKYDLGSCTEGTADYHMEEALSEGWHTIKVKAWDLQNNSSESTILVYINESLAPEIEVFAIYPNPATDQFTVYIKTNRPDEVQIVECYLYDLYGRQIAKKELKDKPTDGAWTIDWDLHKNGEISSGLYLFYVRVATENSDYAEKTEKIIVVDERK